jgi:hypothetical protein
LLRPKSFGGLFGAAPSIALASLALTAMTKGQAEAATNAHAMIAGGIAMLIYALTVSFFLLRLRSGAFITALGGLLLWFAAAVAGWVILC